MTAKRAPAMVFLRLWMALFFLLATGVPYGAQAESEFHFSNELSATYNSVSGPGSSSSSLTDGLNYLDIFGANGGGTFKGYSYSYLLGMKATNDERNDARDLSLTNLQAKISDRVNTFTVGDTFEAFTQYSLSTALKGAAYKYFNEAANSPELTAVYGVAYPRWDNLWNDPATKTIRREAYGGRAKYAFSPEIAGGVSVVRSDDSRRITTTDSLYASTVYSIDMDYRPIPGLTVFGEAALNDSVFSSAEDAADDNKHGSAFKLEATGDGGPSRVTLEYERISPDFIAPVGAAYADREKFKARWRYRYSNTVTMRTGFLWYRNNLEGTQVNGTVQNYQPEIGVSVKKMFGRQFSFVDASYRFDRIYGGGSSTVNHILNTLYRDRFGIFDSETALGYTLYNTEDRIRNTHELMYNTSLSSRHSAGMAILKPGIYLGGSTVSDELANTKDVMYEYSLALGVDVPDWKLTSTTKIGQNRLDKGTPGSDDSQKTFASVAAYYRPAFLAAYNQGMLFLRGFVNNYGYSTGSRNFRENSITFGVNIQM